MGHDQVAKVEGGVEDVEGLEHPVEAVAGGGAEDAQDEEDDGDFGEAHGGAVEGVAVVAVLRVGCELVLCMYGKGVGRIETEWGIW